jgi:hypothetical protein
MRLASRQTGGQRGTGETMFRLYAAGPETNGTARFLDDLLGGLRQVRRLGSHVIVNDGEANPMAATNCRAEGGQR